MSENDHDMNDEVTTVYNNNNNNDDDDDEEVIEIPLQPPTKPPNITNYYAESRRDEAISQHRDMSPTEIDQMLRTQWREGLGKNGKEIVKREWKAIKSTFAKQLALYSKHNPSFDATQWYGELKANKNKSSKRSHSNNNNNNNNSSRRRGGGGGGSRQNKFLMNAWDDESDDDAPPKKRQKLNNDSNNNNNSSNADDKQLTQMDFLENIIRTTGKGRGRRKRNKDDGDIIQDDDKDTVEAMEKLCNDMRLAAKKDRKCNELKKPAIYMTQMVDYVSQQLSKTHLQRIFIESEHCYVLDCIRDWIHPLPDGSLPPVKVRQEMYRIIEIFELHRQQSIKDYLQSSEDRSIAEQHELEDEMDGDFDPENNNNNNNNNNVNNNENIKVLPGFGKTLLLLWSHSLEIESNKRRLRAIILRMVHHLTQGLREQEEEDIDRNKEEARRRNAVLRKQTRNFTLAALAGPRKRAQVPERPGFDFAFNPSNMSSQVGDDVGKPMMHNRRLEFEKRFKSMSATKHNQAMKPSVTGRRR